MVNCSAIHAPGLPGDPCLVRWVVGWAAIHGLGLAGGLGLVGWVEAVYDPYLLTGWAAGWAAG
ncbi:hypothetical protein T492DRAFT_879893 [Pavlovales sp. CCMP2436]|nr:hypothetical protein T492DRAFT_879893 [Pavlovales sp. CCMP2436]